jgi:hypothetical protein
MFRILVFLFLLPLGGALAQHVGVGVKAGARVTDDLDTWYAQSESKRYVVGPMIELRLPYGFGLEFDALYRRLGYRTDNGSIYGSYNSRTRAKVWEFPMLGKYRLPLLRRAQPFVAAGWAPRHISGNDHSEGYTVNFTTGERTPYVYDSKWRPDSTHGVVAAGGFEFGAGRLHFSPEFRYTHWNKDPIAIWGSHGYYVSANENQMEVLVGFTWR